MKTCKTLNQIGKENLSLGSFLCHYGLCISRLRKSNGIQHIGHVSKRNRIYYLVATDRGIKSLSVISRFDRYKQCYPIRMNIKIKKDKCFLYVNTINIPNDTPKFYEQLDIFIKEYKMQKIYSLIPSIQKIEIDNLIHKFSHNRQSN